ncbi:MAG: hypothetical protein Aurels2KO_45030 [Aureliella sp.]
MVVVVCCVMTPATASGQSVRLNWSADGERCWYHVSRNGRRDFFVVDVANRRKEMAFDAARLAAGLSTAAEEDISLSNLAIERLVLTPDPAELLVARKGRLWQVDLQNYRVRAAEPTDAAPSSPQLFLPPRGSGPSNESTEITVCNSLAEPIQLVWVDSRRNERPYQKVAPGESLEQHTYVGHVWLIKSATGKSLGCFSAVAGMNLVVDDKLLQSVRRREGRGRRWSTGSGAWRSGRSAKSPDGRWECFVKNDNLWVRGDGDEHQLSDDGTEQDSYSPLYVRWAPDSAHVMAFKTRVVPERKVYLIESSPDDQLQPKLDSYPYRKPGDELPTRTTCLFSMDELQQIPVDNSLMPNPWSLRFRRWSESGDRFYLHYNQRGHQHLRLLEVMSETGQVSAVIDESSETFLHYSDAGKSVCEWLGADEILWASERSGWNHLYRYSVSEKKLLGAVTQGAWNVKRVVDVDEERGGIWLIAVGVADGQDPYHEHFCRVDMSGENFLVLTDGDGTHSIEFQQDRRFFIDRWSRVDLAPVRQLRDSATGQLICDLTREDTSERFTQRRLTERFVAKGRDGETDIWGIIHWPQNFDPSRRYPIVENIYAGPHDHHVPKSFRARYGHQHTIADAGCIVVQIDGMGTAWRSKAFHDVCYKNLRDAGFPDRIAWIKAAAEKYPQMDLSRVGIYGGSAGGQNAMAALLWHNDFYKVAVADCGCHDNRMDKIWWNEQWMGWPVDDSYVANSNMENAHLLKGHLMLIVGERDHNVDPATTTQVVKRLINHDKDFEFVLVPGVGHGSAETPWASRKRLRFLAEHLEMYSVIKQAVDR